MLNLLAGVLWSRLSRMRRGHQCGGDHDLQFHRVRRQLYLCRCRTCDGRFVYDSMDNVMIRYDLNQRKKEEVIHRYPDLRGYHL